MTIETQIVNGTIQQTIITTDPISSIVLPIGLIIATLSVAGITFFYNKKTHQVLKTELEMRMRPLFKLINTKSSLQGKQDDLKIRLYYTIKNMGTVHARKIRIRTFESDNTEINNIVKEWDKIKNSSAPLDTIQIDGEVSHFDDIEWKHDKRSTNWIIWLEYEYLEKMEKCVIVFPSLGGGQEPVDHKWFVHEDVIEAEKRWNAERTGNVSAPI